MSEWSDASVAQPRYFGFLAKGNRDPEEFGDWLKTLTEVPCEQVILDNEDLLMQLIQGDVLLLPSFLEVGDASFDMWPIVFDLHDLGVAIQTLDDGFVSSMPDGDKVMDTLRRAIQSQRNYFERKP